MKNEILLTRRDFMKGSAVVALGAVTGFTSETVSTAGPSARVVVVRDERVIDDTTFRVDGHIVQSMLDQAVMNLLSAESADKVWSSLFSSTDVVGIKSNVWQYLPTPSELESALVKGVLRSGVPLENIAIDDRGVLHNPVFKRATALINVRPLRTHHWSGIGGVIKNYVMFVPDPYNYHDDSCANLATIWQLPIIRGKTRLNILSAIQIQFHGRGPHHFDKRYLFNYKGLIVGTDPVAVDAIGLRLVQATRTQHFSEERNLSTPPHHILYADTRHKLGISDPKRIELIKRGDMKGMLI